MSIFGLVSVIDEVTMIRLMGRDLAMYLKYIKYQAYMFAIILLMNWTILLPLYYLGEDAERSFNIGKQDQTKFDSNASVSQDEEGVTEANVSQEYNLIKMTILNVTSDNYSLNIALIFVYLTTLIAYL